MLTRALDYLNRKGKSGSCRLVQWTGKSPHRIHPKHLVDDPEQHWHTQIPGDPRRILDLGCGHGAHMLPWTAGSRLVIGLDHDPEAVAVANRRLGERHFSFSPLNASARRHDLETPLPLPDQFFDLVLALDILEHLDHRAEFLAEVKRVARPGALVLFSAPNARTRWRDRLRRAGLDARHDRDHKIEFDSEDELGFLLTDAGFMVQEIHPVVYDTPWAGWIDMVGGIHLGLYARLLAWKRRMAAQHPQETTGWRVVCQRP